MLYLAFIFIILVFIFILYIWLLNKKINILEEKIILELEKRTNLIPTLFEITKDYISKHEEVFSEIMNLRKKEFSWYNSDFLEKINLEILIHHELNFVFKVVLKNPKIEKNSIFLIVRDLFVENSSHIWEKVELYKKIIFLYNRLLKIKNFTLIWYFFNFSEKKWIN